MIENGQNTFSEVTEKEITMTIHIVSTNQLGYFADAWESDNGIYLTKAGKENHTMIKSHIGQLASPTNWGKY